MPRSSGGCLWCGKRAAYRLGMRSVANGRHGHAVYFHVCDRHATEIHDAMNIEVVDGYPLMEGFRSWRATPPLSAGA